MAGGAETPPPKVAFTAGIRALAASLLIRRAAMCFPQASSPPPLPFPLSPSETCAGVELDPLAQPPSLGRTPICVHLQMAVTPTPALTCHLAPPPPEVSSPAASARR